MIPRHFVAALLAGLGLVTGCATNGNIANDPQAPPTEVVIHLSGIQSPHGSLLVFIHDNGVSYHADDDTTARNFNPFAFQKADPVVPMTTVVFKNIPAGRYAISAYHDRDDDGHLNRMIFPFPLMPSEPYGIANDVHAPLSKASFEKALVEIRPPVTEIDIRLSTHLNKLMGD